MSSKEGGIKPVFITTARSMRLRRQGKDIHLVGIRASWFETALARLLTTRA
jgi:hypothetical protein